MTSSSKPAEAHRGSLTGFLQAQRVSVLAIVKGLSEDQLRSSVVPSGWTALSMIWHLRAAEQHWFERVVSGCEPQTQAEPAGAALLTDRSAENVLLSYRAQIERSNAILAITSLDAVPLGKVWPEVEGVRCVGDIVLHMIEETARHAGHLDIARELVDGATGLGPR